MAYIDWSERYSVSDKHLDSQHKGLFALINQLHEAILERRGRDFMVELFAELGKYVEQHFRDEEAHMRRISHAELPRHQADHKYFIDAIGELRARCEEGDGNVGVDTIDFLTHWLIDHIMGRDRKYIPDSQAA
ncbi:MAG: hemerythrin family protein [Rhodocyclales bacterium]|nr:hemerythrin family protein [Rhodocyclales bacterium]